MNSAATLVTAGRLVMRETMPDVDSFVECTGVSS
jgi:hypothetical protein